MKVLVEPSSSSPTFSYDEGGNTKQTQTSLSEEGEDQEGRRLTELSDTDEDLYNNSRLTYNSPLT